MTPALAQLIQQWRDKANEKLNPGGGLFKHSERTVATLRQCADDLEAALARPGEPEEQRVCLKCANLRPFELADDILTCPVLNIRLHETTIETFGCSLWEPGGELTRTAHTAHVPGGREPKEEKP